MADVKDILGVPRSGGAAGNAEPKEKKEKVKRPEGMSREAFALLGSSHPIISSHLADGLKKKELLKLSKPKPSTKGVLTYQYKAFSNPARSDGLELRHWVKGYRDGSGRIRDAEEEYAYAKLNKKVQLYKYDDEEWQSLLSDYSRNWTRQETDYLMDMCEQFDLRFVVIADRYDFPGGPLRTLEDLKDRYYSIARRLLIEREGGESAVANVTLVKYPYNRAHETDRKRALHRLLSRTAQQAQEENVILAEAKVIEDKRRLEVPPPSVRKPAAEAAAPAAAAPPPRLQPPPPPAEAEPYHSDGQFKYPQEFSNHPGPGVPSLFDLDLHPYRQPHPGVVSRSAHTQQTATIMANAMAGGARAFKNVETTLQELGWPPEKVPRTHTRAVCGAWLALRGEVIAMHDLKRSLQNRTLGAGGDDRPRGKEPKRRR